MLNEILIFVQFTLWPATIVGFLCVKAPARTLGMVGAAGCLLVVIQMSWAYVVPDAYPVMFAGVAGYAMILGTAVMLATLRLRGRYFYTQPRRSRVRPVGHEGR